MPDTPVRGGGDHFFRKLCPKDGRSIIESTCRHCGGVIVGSASETLPADEEKHVVVCLKARIARRRHWFRNLLKPVPRFHDPQERNGRRK
jgi:hypothetical protein